LSVTHEDNGPFTLDALLNDFAQEPAGFLGPIMRFDPGVVEWHTGHAVYRPGCQRLTNPDISRQSHVHGQSDSCEVRSEDGTLDDLRLDLALDLCLDLAFD
jgi:hypothetical protein